jgi:hypothetical protein
MAKEGRDWRQAVVAIKEDRVILKANGQLHLLKETLRPQTKEESL